MFSATISRSFADSMADFTGKMLNEAVERLALKYGFDVDDAKAFLLAGGVEVKLPTLERSKLPWCNVVDPSCCKAIQKNGGLFTQCTNSPLDGGWCKKCAKDVEKKGTPTYGDVEARMACDIMKYKIGKTEVKPYIDIMAKEGITREQAEAAATEFGLTIDPRQFEKKKRGRKNTTPRVMAPVVNVPAPEVESAEEPEMVTTPLTASELAAEPIAELAVEVNTPKIDLKALHEERVARAAAAAAAELPSEGAVPDDKLTIKGINSMKKEEVHQACARYGITIEGQNILDLKKALKTKVN
jgi:hypothetical protein